MTDAGFYTRTEDIQPSGRVYIVLRCNDCGGEVRLAKGGGGDDKAAQMIGEHKPSGCCDDRQAANAQQATE